MCIAFILWQCHPHYRFFLALNRDEIHNRPTLPVHWWPEYSEILAGKDLSKGGTWFGCTKNGRIALVTSFREPSKEEVSISRGELITSFLKSSKAPLQFAQEVSEAGSRYNGFNLLVADLCLGSMAYVSNRPREKPMKAHSVMSGFHVLCNASLNTPWPKVMRGRAILDSLVKQSLSDEELKKRVFMELLMDEVKADTRFLPETGSGATWEHHQSPIFVSCDSQLGPYGTRSMIIFTVDNGGGVKLNERYLEDGCWKEHEFGFDLPKACDGDGHCC